MYLVDFFFKTYFKFRYFRVKSIYQDWEKVQAQTLEMIVNNNLNTEYLYNLDIKSCQEFKSKCPLRDYDEYESDIQLIKNTETNKLSQDKIIAFSKSSGTTSRSKYIPISQFFLDRNYQIARDLISIYIQSNEKSNLLKGKNFSLTGSLTNENGFIIGDISSLIAYYLPKIYQSYKTPSIDIATIENWEEKLDKLMPILSSQDIRWIAGVPSWIKVVIEHLESYNQKSIADIWPNLELYFHGGVSIEPFRYFFNQKLPHLNLWQTYNASEGFFGIQMEPNSDWMTLIPNSGTYYEFIKYNNEDLNIISSNDVEIGKLYELIITNNSGLYRYRIGDLIEIKSLNPIQFIIIGRTKNCINTFGEELMVSNTEKAISILKQELDFEIIDYTIAPILLETDNHHLWMIEFEKLPKNLDTFTISLDGILRQINSDYDAKRSNNYILKNLRVEILPKSSFEKYLKLEKRLNVQSKIPKLWKDQSIQDRIRITILNQ